MKLKYAFVAAQAKEYPVRVLCRVLGLTRSGYYAWRNQVSSARAKQDQDLTGQIRAVFERSRQTYGSPRVHAQLQAEGLRCARKRVARLMRAARLVARPRRPRIATTDSRHSMPIAPNLLERCFTAEAPNQRWVADITYLPTREGWLYLAVVLDLFARRVVGWSMQPTLERQVVLAALTDALRRRKPAAGLIHHSDRGSQYASADYQQLLKQHAIRVSMSRRANCWDNAAIESFFATLKTELRQEVFASHAQARLAVFDYIERFYNRQRRHSTLEYRSPVEFEQLFHASQKVA